MKDGTKSKMPKLLHSIGGVGFICLITIPVLLLINKTFFGQELFLFIYCLIVIVTFGSRAVEFAVTGEAIIPWKVVKRSEKPVAYYYALILNSVIAIFFIYVFISGIIGKIGR